MNEIVITFLLAGDKYMPEMHLKQAGNTYSDCGPVSKNKERIQEIQTGDTNKTQEVQTTYTKMNLIKLVFNMMWHMEVLKIQLEEQVLTKF